MTQIGEFHRTRTGYDGRLHTLALDVRLTLIPAEPSDAENAPEWRVMIGSGEAALEVGAGWDRTGERAGPYVSLMIDCPSLPQPIRANLFKSAQQENLHHLLWNRPPRRERQA
ncbi:DUF736 domain-containing protein [Brevundimonas diminuta]|uniref:DUF736 domain-containing protein n=1 Tax=Brevundimonas diminuta TaxID=293 RepID=UPI0019BFD9E3|nr:DUF736 domain-containing protein [Brevundimonas diminuta]MBD3817409.1 DUF736 domain-containing protein [Brevundimonas diminuta]